MPAGFFDSNVLIYLASADRIKADRAEKLVARGGTISVQVLNKISNVARRKMNLSWSETRVFLAALRTLLAVEPLTIEIHDSGLSLAERYGLSVYDGLIAASALRAGCGTLWSADVHHGLRIGRLRIANPFL